LTPGTEAGTECVYATTEATQNDYGIAGTVSTAFGETTKQWNANGVTLQTEEALARELAPPLDAESR
jgi:hypothetical protein